MPRGRCMTILCILLWCSVVATGFAGSCRSLSRWFSRMAHSLEVEVALQEGVQREGAQQHALQVGAIQAQAAAFMPFLGWQELAQEVERVENQARELV